MSIPSNHAGHDAGVMPPQPADRLGHVPAFPSRPKAPQALPYLDQWDDRQLWVPDLWGFDARE
ncbi:MAG: hypothetical protein ABIT83_01615 [Massilia sp.]